MRTILIHWAPILPQNCCINGLKIMRKFVSLYAKLKESPNPILFPHVIQNIFIFIPL